MMSVQSKIEEKSKVARIILSLKMDYHLPNLEYLSTLKMILVTNTKGSIIVDYCPKANNRFKVSGVDKDGRKYQIGEQDQCYKNLEELKKEINELAIIDDERLKSKDPVSSFYSGLLNRN